MTTDSQKPSPKNQKELSAAEEQAAIQAELAEKQKAAKMKYDTAMVILSQTEIGKKFVDYFKDHKMDVQFDDQMQGVSPAVSPTSMVLRVNPTYDPASLALMVGNALIITYALEEGYQANVAYHPASNYLVERFSQASEKAHYVQLAHEIGQATNMDFLTVLEQQGDDMAMAFKHLSDCDATKGTDYVATGQAWRAAFDQWFSSFERRYQSDTATLKMSEMNMHRYAGPEAIEPEIFTEEQYQVVATLPDGTNHLKSTKGYDLTGGHYFAALTSQDYLMLNSMISSLEAQNSVEKISFGMIPPSEEEEVQTRMTTIGFHNKEEEVAKGTFKGMDLPKKDKSSVVQTPKAKRKGRALRP